MIGHVLRFADLANARFHLLAVRGGVFLVCFAYLSCALSIRVDGCPCTRSTAYLVDVIPLKAIPAHWTGWKRLSGLGLRFQAVSALRLILIAAQECLAALRARDCARLEFCQLLGVCVFQQMVARCLDLLFAGAAACSRAAQLPRIPRNEICFADDAAFRKKYLAHQKPPSSYLIRFCAE